MATVKFGAKGGPRSKPQTTNTRVVVRFRPINKLERKAWKKDLFETCIKEAELGPFATKIQAVPELKDPINWPKYADEKYDSFLRDRTGMKPGHLRLFKRFCRKFDFSRLDASNLDDIVPVKVYEEEKQVQIYSPDLGKIKAFNFDEVMWWQRDQTYCFQTIALPVMEDALNGFNATIFAYGQSGSGKTYSLFGPEPLDKAPSDQLGVIPSSLAWIFKQLEDDTTNKFFEVKLSFLEVYLEALRDLMQPYDERGKEKKLKILELAGGKAALEAMRGKASKQGKANAKRRSGRTGRGRKESKTKSLPIEVIIDNLSEQRVDNIKDVQTLIAKAAFNRMKEKTNLNVSSSRSHLIMTVRLNITKKSGTVIRSKINFADLAGSEKVGKTNVTGKHLKEAAAINTSLTALRGVIDGLVKGKKFVNFRDSKLTRALRDSLGGNTKTTLVLACSPHKWNGDETLETLKFGARAKFIRSKVIMNAQASVEELEQSLKKMKKENELMKKQLQILNAKQGMIRSIQVPEGKSPEVVDFLDSPPSVRARSSSVLAGLKQERGRYSVSCFMDVLSPKRTPMRGKHWRTSSAAVTSLLEKNQSRLQLQLSLRGAKDEVKELKAQLKEAVEREKKLTEHVEEQNEKIDKLKFNERTRQLEDIQTQEIIEERASLFTGQLDTLQKELEDKTRQLAEALSKIEKYQQMANNQDLLTTQNIFAVHGNNNVQEQSEGITDRINKLPPTPRKKSVRTGIFAEEKEEDIYEDSPGILTPNLSEKSGITTVTEVVDEIRMGFNRGEMDAGGIEAILVVLKKVATMDNPSEVITLNQLMLFFEQGKLDVQTCMRVYDYLGNDYKVTVSDIRQVVEATQMSLRLRTRAASFKDYLIKIAEDFAALIDDLPEIEDVLDGDGASLVTLDDITQIELGEVHSLILQEAFQFIQSDERDEVLLIDFQIFIDHLTGRGEILGLESGYLIPEEPEYMEYYGFRSELIDPVSKIFNSEGKKYLSLKGAKLVLQEIRENLEAIEDDDPALRILPDLTLNNLVAVIRTCPETMWHTLIEPDAYY